MVQHPALGFHTSEAQAWNPAGAPRPSQLHGMEEKEENKQTNKTNRQKPKTNSKSTTKQTKSHKETYTHTLTKQKEQTEPQDKW